MAKNKKGRDRWDGATPNTYDIPNYIGADLLTEWFSLAKSSRANRRQKHRWQRGRK